MKKLICITLFMMLLCSAALADGQWNVSWDTIGGQYNRNGDWEEIISIQVTTPAGQAVQTFPAIIEDNARDGGVLTQDINGDGYDDIVVITVMGASNTWYSLYLWMPQEYRFVPVMNEPLCNFSLLEDGRIVSHSANGWAGLLHETDVYSWGSDGYTLTWVASSVWNTLEEETFTYDDNSWTQMLTGSDQFITETYTFADGETIVYTFETEKYQTDEAFMYDRFAVEEELLQLK